MLMVILLGQYMQEALLSASRPTHLPSFARPPSLELAVSYTTTRLPHSWASDRSGFILVSAWSGVTCSRALVEVRFLSQVACANASPHRLFGNCVLWSMVRTFSRRV